MHRATGKWIVVNRAKYLEKKVYTHKKKFWTASKIRFMGINTMRNRVM